MQEFSNHQNRPRLAHRPALAVALAVLVLGGGAFAATGGIAKLKSWVFRVNINGQEATLIANDGEPASMIIQGEDGKTTHIAVMSASDDVGHSTEVKVDADDPNNGEQNQQHVKIVRRTAGGPMPDMGGNYTVADLGGAEPNQTWTDKEGRSMSIYVIPGADRTVKVFRTVTDAKGQVTVNLIAAPKLEFDLSKVKPEVSTDEDGMTKMVFDDGQGERRVMKFKIAHGDEEGNLPGDGSINIKTEDGHIQVEVNKNTDQD